MKKFLVILMAICMMVSVLSITAFAAEEPVAGTVLRVSALKTDGSTVVIKDYDNFEDGWNAAMELANNSSEIKKNGYDRIVVDLYADWTADQYGNFTDDGIFDVNGAGFDNDTIYFNDDVRMTLNMNGHTISRNIRAFRNDGEVMYIDTDADVIINDGTITSGRSYNGAGGIHIKSGAKVTLNNVHIIDNMTNDDEGAGISLEKATLIMNGGSLKDNLIKDGNGGAIYAENSTVFLNNVEIKNNQARTNNTHGAAIYADDSNVTINECAFEGNGVKDEAQGFLAAVSVIHADDSSITVKNTSFNKNGSLYASTTDVSTLILLDDSTLIMEDGNSITGNVLGHMIRTAGVSTFYISDTTFTNNNGTVLKSPQHTDDSYFINCTFNKNGGANALAADRFSFLSHTFITNCAITFYDCDMGNSTYSNAKVIKFDNQDGSPRAFLAAGSIFGDGSLTMIVAILALVASGVSIFLFVDMKKKLVPVATNNAKETDDEE